MIEQLLWYVDARGRFDQAVLDVDESDESSLESQPRGKIFESWLHQLVKLQQATGGLPGLVEI
jgi:hypothetical protein